MVWIVPMCLLLLAARSKVATIGMESGTCGRDLCKCDIETGVKTCSPEAAIVLGKNEVCCGRHVCDNALLGHPKNGLGETTQGSVCRIPFCNCSSLPTCRRDSSVMFSRSEHFAVVEQPFLTETKVLKRGFECYTTDMPKCAGSNHVVFVRDRKTFYCSNGTERKCPKGSLFYTSDATGIGRCVKIKELSDLK